MSDAVDLWQPPNLRVVSAADTERARIDALQAATQRGYDEGLRRGLDEGRQQSSALVAEMETLWEAMQHPFANMEQSVHSELLGLCCAVAQAVLERELCTEPEAIDRALAGGLAALTRSEGAIEVTLNPKDYERVEQLLDGKPIQATLLADPNLMPGGCRIRRGSATVDASIETKLRRIIRALADGIAVDHNKDDAVESTPSPTVDADQIGEFAQRLVGDDDAD